MSSVPARKPSALSRATSSTGKFISHKGADGEQLYCSRTCAGWKKLGAFYFTFYAILIGFFAICFHAMVDSLPETAPGVSGEPRDSSIIKRGRLVLQGISSYSHLPEGQDPFKSGDDARDFSVMPELRIFPTAASATTNKADVTAFAEQIHVGYEAGKAKLGGPLGPVSSHFSDDELDLEHDYQGVGNANTGSNNESFAGAVELLAQETSCTLAENYGYDSNSPCIFMTLNSVWGFPNAVVEVEQDSETNPVTLVTLKDNGAITCSVANLPGNGLPDGVTLAQRSHSTDTPTANGASIASESVKLNQLYCFKDTTRVSDGYAVNNKGPYQLSECSPFKNQVNYRRPIGIVKPYLEFAGGSSFPADKNVIEVVVDCMVEKLVLSRDERGYDCEKSLKTLNGFEDADCDEGTARLDSPYGSDDPVAKGRSRFKLAFYK